MKIDIFIPDDLVAAADGLADHLGVTRSELYVTALREYVAGHRYDHVTERLDALYDQEPSALASALMELQVRSLPPEECWRSADAAIHEGQGAAPSGADLVASLLELEPVEPATWDEMERLIEEGCERIDPPNRS